MAKTNISMPDALLEEVDERARLAGTTRSGFLQEAAAHYIASLDERDEATARAERIQRAIDGIAEIAAKLPPGEPSGVTLRRMRDTPRSWMVSGGDDE